VIFDAPLPGGADALLLDEAALLRAVERIESELLGPPPGRSVRPRASGSGSVDAPELRLQG